MGIDKLNFGEVLERFPEIWREPGRIWAVWPSPVDHDLCFQSAGFDEMSDSDDAWDGEMSAIIARTVASLSDLGGGAVVDGEYLVGKKDGRSLHEALLAGTKDDNLQPPVVAFGEPPSASVRTSDGHPVLWIWLAEGDLRERLPYVADGHPLAERQLNWAGLVPRPRPLHPSRSRPWWRFW
jgi:hypothetical protein